MIGYAKNFSDSTLLSALFKELSCVRKILLGFPGKFTGRELSPKVKEIEPSGFQQNVRLEILQLAPQEQNLGQPRF